MKRFAAHYINNLETGESHKQAVVEIDTYGYVSTVFSLIQEIESAEWLPGVIELAHEDDNLVAYHLYPFDFTRMQPVGETLRKRLL